MENLPRAKDLRSVKCSATATMAGMYMKPNPTPVITE